MRAIFAAALVTFAGTAFGQSISYPVSIPQDCIELAQREGVPVVIQSKYEATKAQLRLARLSDSDPLVHQCRTAIALARTALQASKQ